MYDSLYYSFRVSHRLTPSCVFSENLVEIFKILQDFLRYSKKFRRSYKNFRGKLQNTLLSQPQWQEISQVFRIIIIILMYMSQEVGCPFSEVNTCQLATSHHSVHDGCFLSRIMVSTEHIVLSADG